MVVVLSSSVPLSQVVHQLLDAQLLVARQPDTCNDWLRIEKEEDMREAMTARNDRIDELYLHETYVQATPPERVWQGLTDPAVTKRYWRHHKAGAKTSPLGLERGLDLGPGARGSGARRE